MSLVQTAATNEWSDNVSVNGTKRAQNIFRSFAPVPVVYRRFCSAAKCGELFNQWILLQRGRRFQQRQILLLSGRLLTQHYVRVVCKRGAFWCHRPCLIMQHRSRYIYKGSVSYWTFARVPVVCFQLRTVNNVGSADFTAINASVPLELDMYQNNNWTHAFWWNTCRCR